MSAGQKDTVCSYEVTKHKEIREQKKLVKKNEQKRTTQKSNKKR